MSGPLDSAGSGGHRKGTAIHVVDVAVRQRALLDALLQKVEGYNPSLDADLITRAFQVAASQHETQLRASGEAYLNHPVGTADICAGLRLDSATIAAALLHDVVEDTSMSIEAVRNEFGDEVALLVDGVTKLSQMSFRTVEEEQAENIRKMIIAMAKDIRVILIKLADRLHNMRTLGYLEKEKQIQKAKETLEVYAPLAHRLGIESVRWELEDLAFATLHPRKYAEVQEMVAQRRGDRERDMEEARSILEQELSAVGISAEISGRAKHFYSIYDKMVRKGKEFNEILDLTALRVLVDSVKDCYAALGVIHSLWKPLPGRFKDYVAMPKFNMYQSLHTTVIGPQGRPVEIQIRTYDMHETAEYGIAAHWIYKEKGGRGGVQRAAAGELEKLQWLRQIMDWQSETKDPSEFMESLRIDLFHDEVYVFTPKGEVKSLPAGSTPVDFAYAIHTDVGHRCIGAKANGHIVPLTYRLQSGDIVEILTSKTAQGPSRDWLQFVESSGARNKIRQWFKRELREDAEHVGREALLEALRKQGLPAQRLIGSDFLAEVMKETNHHRKEDFFIAVGSGKISPQHVATRIIQSLNRTSEGPAAVLSVPGTAPKDTKGVSSSSQLGIHVDGIEDVAIRIPECCRPVPGDDVIGYISLGRGITIHRRDCPNVRSLERNPERFTAVHWDTRVKTPLRVEIQVEAYDRNHLLEDISRTLSESGISIIAAHIFTARNNMVKDRFVFDVPEIDYLETILQRIRRIDTVYDAYRVTPR